MSLRLAHLKDGRKAIIIRTSDRIQFKKCRRAWAWSSHLKGNLGPSYLATPLWFGSGIHYALEDFHGHNHFGRPSDAWTAFALSTAKQHIRDLPDDAQEHFELGRAMMDYYVDYWLAQRKVDPTYWENGIPQVEVNFEIEVPIWEKHLEHLAELARACGADCVLYRGTFDRVAIDELGQLWVVEYKTAKRAETNHYMTDPQVTTYVWAASHVYNRPVAGVIYQQFMKDIPSEPKILSSGKISTAENMNTSAPLYRKALVSMYGAYEAAPKANQEKYVALMMQENENKDRYILREKLPRGSHMLESEAQKILLELEDMINPNLPLYPNPTRECSRMCSFMSACVSMDDGGDWENDLQLNYSERDQAADRMWRRRLPSPEQLKRIRDEGKQLPRLEDIQLHVKALTEEKRDRVVSGEDDPIFSF